MKSLPLLWLLGAAVPALLRGQPTGRVVSPEVRADRTVTFRLRAPGAQEVRVAREGMPALTMLRGADGVWSATSGPLAPDYYGYSFVADGVNLLDPSNPGLVRPNLLSLSNMVHVPGPASLPWELNDVPRGDLHHHFYRSAVLGEESDYWVYTPPAYEPRGAALYPVLFLLHGLTDDARAWSELGRVNVMLDNLIARGLARPMVVVMPEGYGTRRALLPGITHSDPALRDLNYARFGEALLGEVLPQVQSAYRIRRDRDGRAIAGLSMGGAESACVGLNHLETFAWICPMSAAVIADDYAAEFPGLDAAANSRIHLLWIACGANDGLRHTNDAFRSWLTSRGVRHVDIETPGAHTWMVWRRNFAAFAPLLFQD